jgi:cytochrome c oxidase subunit II
MGSTIPIIPPQASNHAGHYDALFWLLTLLTVVFSVGVGVLILYFAIKYREGSPANRDRPSHENLKIELAWTIIPLFLAMGAFVLGAWQFVEFRRPPADVTEVFVIGKQWMWHVQHANGVREMNELTVPVGRPIKLTMISQDVLHSFYVPAFRIHYHVVPGRYTTQWFTATRPGKYQLWCNNYCGTDHSIMGGYVYVLPEQEFQEWLERGGERSAAQGHPSLVLQGHELFERYQCGTCHGPENTRDGPTLSGLAGTTRQFTNGQTAIADDMYLREAIVNPHARVTAGWSDTMPIYKELNEEQLIRLIAYIKSMGTPEDPRRAAAAAGITPQAQQGNGAQGTGN